MNRSEEITTLITSSIIFPYAFWNSFTSKLNTTGYVQLEKYYRHYSSSERKELLLQLNNPKMQNLLEKSVTNEQDFLAVIKEIKNVDFDQLYSPVLTEECCKAIVSWLLYCNKQRYLRLIRVGLAQTSMKIHKGYLFVDEKYIIKENIDFNIIEDLKSFIEVVLQLYPQNKLFFRGQSSLNYWIQPSISRNIKHLKGEAQLYQELVLRCPNDFEKCKSHLDYLVEMQHYGLPTRLIDITSNPLVALFFAASEKDDSDDGEVVVFDIPETLLKYERSDTVTILSCLPLFSFQEQQHLLLLAKTSTVDEFNKDETVLRLLHEIKIDKPAFTNRILPNHLSKNLIVTPSMKNNRIVKQSGAFIICGLVDNYFQLNPFESFRYINSKEQKVLIIIKNKKVLLKELRSFDVHSATLFPEIDDVANYLKNDWLS